MAFGDKAKLVFDIEANSGAAKREIDSLYGKINNLGGGFTAAFGGAIPMAAAAAAGIAAVATAAIATGAAIFNLTKSAADYGSAIFDATQQTGLGAETISALKIAADQSSSSLENITGSIAKFNVLVGQANQGNEKANATLARYGVTARDTDAALAQAIKTIAEMTSADQQAAAAKDLFKDRTAAILPVIKSFDGDLPGLINKLRDLGVLMSDEDARAADEFGDTLDTLTTQAGALGRQFATELMPMMTDAMRSISRFMAENKGVARQWGQEVVYTVNGVGTLFNVLSKGIELQLAAVSFGLIDNQKVWVNWGNVLLSNLGIIGQTILALNTLGRAFDNGLVRGGLGGKFSHLEISSIESAGGGRGKGTGRSAANEAAQRAARDLSAQIGVENINLQTIKDELGKTFDEIRKEFSQTDDAEKFFNASREAMQRFAAALQTSLQLIEELERRQLKADATENERALLKAQQQERRNRIVKLGQDEYAQNNKELEAAEKRRADAAEEQLTRELNLTKKLIDAERERLELLKQFPTPPSVFESPEAFGIDVTAGLPPLLEDYYFGLGQSLDQFFNLVEERGPQIGEVLQEIGRIAANAFQQFADGIGQMVQAWILYGSVGPNALRKLLAATLASIAAESAVRAIFELAKGFAALFLNPAEAAAHFKAAALFGAIAGGTALAGRAVAGNSFNQAAGAATGGGNGAGGNSSNNDPSARQNNFTTPFTGFGDRVGQLVQRQNEVLGQFEETMYRFNQKFGVATAGDVVMAGAAQEPGAIRSAYEGELGNDVKATDTFYRNTGRPF